MSDLKITALSNSRRDVCRFLQLEQQVYRTDPCFIPGFRSERKSFLRKGPFHEHGRKQLFLAQRGGQSVARLCVHQNFAHERIYGTGRGFFGFFEALDDSEAVAQLFQEGVDWLVARGCHEIVGPMSFGIYDEVGMLLNCFDRVPSVACPHNPEYYPRLMENLGFRKEVDWFSFPFEGTFEVPGSIERVADRARAAPGISVRTVDSSRWDEEGERLRRIFNKAWSENWGHVPMSQEQWSDILTRMKPAIIPDLTFLIYHHDQAVAMSVTIKDVNEALAKMKRRAEWWDMLNLGLRLGRIRSLRTVLLGVLDLSRHRGLEVVLILETLRRGKEMGFQSCDCSQVVETNSAMLSTLTRIGLQPQKIWRVYRKELGGSR